MWVLLSLPALVFRYTAMILDTSIVSVYFILNNNKLVLEKNRFIQYWSELENA